MCIVRSVGRNAVNQKADVKSVQVLLNMNLKQIAPLPPLKEDGSIGDKTLAAIAEFQRRAVGITPNELVEPESATLRRLRAGMPQEFVQPKLSGMMPEAEAEVVALYYPSLTAQMAANGINTPLRMSHFLAQIGHESGDLRFNEEIADGSRYEGRLDLGNTQPGDGRRFKGRGLIQLTGRANYVAYGKARNRDFVTGENHRLIAADPDLAVDVACWFWVKKGLNELADADNVREITRRINGGFNGFDDRKTRLVRSKWFLLTEAGAATGSA